ncbi:transmembrane repetitive protein [Lysobacter silvisoli]|uniref:Transmembrane repetitive protein n=1 Tax=Lysobacter silvisoli TaxID=2293254 RepID=A0A371K4A1_9GAMM|nr:transmembrane repetitive protein [Lysobacter silvisoli]RDZ28700.1 transmembrane repetitive protein [Lysobacter silvisoli]
MVSAAALIEAVQRRLRLTLRRDSAKPGEFPPGWAEWLAAMAQRPGQVVGAPAQSLVDLLAERPLAQAPRRTGELNRWQAFATLWRQQWQPAGRETRGVHWFAVATTLLWHLLFGGLLLWLMYLQFLGNPAPPPQGETVVQVEYVGVGTPEEPGGGPDRPSEQPSEAAAPATPAPAPQDAASAPTASAASPPLPTPALEAAVPDVPQREVPEPQLPPPTVEQPVAVSEPVPSQETTAFVLPPTRRRTETAIAAPELSAPSQQVRQADIAEPVQPIARELPQRELAAPALRSRVPEVAAREVPAPLPRAPVRELPTPTTAAPTLRSSTPTVRTRDVPTPRGASQAAASASAPAAAPSSAAPSAAAPSTSGTPQSSGARPAAGTAGAGPKATPAPGSFPTPRRGDDWGDSTRNTPGGQRGVTPGIYNSDGSVRLAEQPGSASPGMPPGTITQEIKNIDRAGTWLRRKPNDYEPTSFDKYWLPNENLLQEWVRRSIKEVNIPIPGTTKKIVCSVSVLALGGACSINDPNLNEQPAIARPPPDVPFKPELQEDNGSVKPPPGG